jgi:hypothetical protein
MKIQSQETWKDIAGYDGKYQVSTFGRIKSERCFKALILNKDGYYRVGLTHNGKTTNNLVHKLVWDTFSEQKSIPFKLMVDHVDNNKSNNHLSNLQLLPNRRNIAKFFQSEGKKTSRYTGVSFLKSNNKWQAQYKIKNKVHYIGSFDDEYEAHLAYEKAIKSLNKAS